MGRIWRRMERGEEKGEGEFNRVAIPSLFSAWLFVVIAKPTSASSYLDIANIPRNAAVIETRPPFPFVSICNVLLLQDRVSNWGKGRGVSR